MATTNLPPVQNEDSAAGTKLFFDTYGLEPLEFNATEVSASISFLEKKGFDTDAALIVSAVILKQAKIDGTPVFKILDTLSGVDALTLSSIVGEILNNNRSSTSTLGFRTTPVIPNQSRNIAP
jgi:hypothetical protein